MGIPFLLSQKAYLLGFLRWLSIEYDSSPHVIWCGRTGSGKTVAAKLLVARSILLAPPEMQPVEVTVIDPKGDTDFDFLDGCAGFCRRRDSPQGLEYAFEMFTQRQSKEDKSRSLKLIFVDEFASLVNLIEGKKEKETAQRRLALLLMLSRSFRFSVQLATQQPTAQIFGGSASREQFGAVCLLGDSGSETQQMLFDAESREQIKAFGSIGGRGVGWLSLNGGVAQAVRVPRVEDMKRLNNIILSNMKGEIL